MNIKKAFLIFFLSVFLFSGLAMVSAQSASCPECPPELKGGFVPCGRICDDPGTDSFNECEPCQLCHFFVMFEKIIDFLLFVIVPPLAVLMIAIGGFMYIFAYISPAEILEGGKKGSPKLFSQAKRIFTSVVIALLIIYGAWLIVNTFFMVIGVAEWTGLKEGWWSIQCP